MSDHRQTGHEAGDDDALAKLVRAAGRRPAPAREDHDRVFAASRAAWQRKLASRRHRKLYALAATVAVLAVGAALLLPRTEPATAATATVLRGRVESYVPKEARWQLVDAAGTAVVDGTRMRTVAGGRAAFRLAGGADLRVDAATEWCFCAGDTIELEAGTIYVDAGASDQSVTVKTPFGAVRDVGTQFEVRASSSTLRVRVRQGAIVWERPDAATSIEGHTGEQLEVARAGEVQRSALPPDAAEYDWAVALAEPLLLDGLSAYDALRWVARETGKRLVFDDVGTELRARNAVLAGGDAGLAPLEVLRVVAATTDDLDIAIESDSIVVRRR